MLVLAPHTDDGEFGCGGTMARLVEAGAEVRYVAFSIATRSLPEGFAGDTLVRNALSELARRTGTGHAFSATISKRVPVAAGLGGGSSDAGTALRLANELVNEPLLNT